MSASQGAAPSTFWGDSALDLMATGAGAGTALQAVTEPDPNRDWRQLALLDPRGGTAAHSGSANSPVCTHRTGPGRVASGNLLAGEATLEVVREREPAVGHRLVERSGRRGA